MEKTKELLKKSTFQSSLMLFLAAFIWGTAFVAQSVGMDYLGPLSFNGARFLMGSLVLAPVICFNRRSAAKKHKENEGKRPGSLKTTIIGGVCCGLALCAAGFGLCLLVLLRCWSGGKERLPLLLAVLGAVLGLAALRAAAQAHAGQRELNDGDILLLEREYAAPHPVCRVWQGEIHLLPGILVCRSGGRLLFLPVDRIEQVEERFDRIGLLRLPFVKLVMDTGRTVSIGLSPHCPEDGRAVLAWLAGHAGQKV